MLKKVKALKSVKSFVKNEKGQGMAEYGLIVVLIAIAVFVVVQAFGSQIGDIFNNITNKLKGVNK